MVTVASCGRLGFEPLARTSDAGGGNGGPADGAPDAPSVAPPDAPPDAPLGPCGGDLSNLSTSADFSIAFTLTTVDTGADALLFQRATCAGATTFWQVTLGTGVATGRAVFQLQDPGGSSLSTSTGVVTDGAPHAIEFRRTAGTVTVFQDGVPGNQSTLALRLGALPALGIATGHPCAANVPLQGTITNVCVQ